MLLEHAFHADIRTSGAGLGAHCDRFTTTAKKSGLQVQSEFAEAILATRQFSRGYGGMMSMRLEGGETEMYAFTDALRMCAIAVSLGDLKTLVYPMPKRDNLIRLSVGCEDIEDLLADLALGLAAARRTRSG